MCPLRDRGDPGCVQESLGKGTGWGRGVQTGRRTRFGPAVWKADIEEKAPWGHVVGMLQANLPGRLRAPHGILSHILQASEQRGDRRTSLHSEAAYRRDGCVLSRTSTTRSQQSSRHLIKEVLLVGRKEESEGAGLRRTYRRVRHPDLLTLPRPSELQALLPREKKRE